MKSESRKRNIWKKIPAQPDVETTIQKKVVQLSPPPLNVMDCP